MQLFLIGAFGALGCISRYLVSGWVYGLAGRALPWGTLAVNLLGSFLLGLLIETGLRTNIFAPEVRVALAIGFMGGFTTFSTFSYETIRLLEDGSFWQAGANVALSLVLCLLGTAAGIMLARQI